MIPVSDITFTGTEAEAVARVLASGRLSQGSVTEEFERAFAAYVGVDHAVACSSGTAALHLALLALDVRPGDAVFVPALTYVATANAVRYCGATPVIVDVNPVSWCMDPAALRPALRFAQRKGLRPVGVLPVHLYGVVAPMDALGAFAYKEGLWLAEDAAQGLGASYRGRKAGALSAVAAFSFFANKVITTGEGGMVTTNDELIAQRARLFRGQCVNTTRHRYYHELVGYNYRMSEVAAAIGFAQLHAIDKSLAVRKRIVDRYRTHGLVHQFVTEDAANWMTTVLVPPPHTPFDVAQRLLADYQIETRPVFVPLNDLPMYASPLQPTAAFVHARGLNLPTHANMTEADVDYIAESYNAIIRS